MRWHTQIIALPNLGEGEQQLTGSDGHWVLYELARRFYRPTPDGLQFSFALGHRHWIGREAEGLWLLDPTTHLATLVDPLHGRPVAARAPVALDPAMADDSARIWQGYVTYRASDELVRMRISDGQLQRFPVQGWSASTLDGGVLGQSGSDEQKELMYFAADGSLRWSFRAEGLELSSFGALACDGVLLGVGVPRTYERVLIGIDIASGRERWRREPIPGQCSDSLEANRFWICSPGRVLGIDPATGETCFDRTYPDSPHVAVKQVSERLVVMLSQNFRPSRIEVMRGHELEQVIPLPGFYRVHWAHYDAAGNVHAFAIRRGGDAYLRFGPEPVEEHVPFPHYEFERILEGKCSVTVARTDARSLDELLFSLPLVVEQISEDTGVVPGIPAKDPQHSGEIRVEAPLFAPDAAEAEALARVLARTTHYLVKIRGIRAVHGRYAVDLTCAGRTLALVREGVTRMEQEDWLALGRTWSNDLLRDLPKEPLTEAEVGLMLSGALGRLMSAADVHAWLSAVNATRGADRRLAGVDGVSVDDLPEALEDLAVTYSGDPVAGLERARRFARAFTALCYAHNAIGTQSLLEALADEPVRRGSDDGVDRAWVTSMADELEDGVASPAMREQVHATIAPLVAQARLAWATLVGILDGHVDVAPWSPEPRRTPKARARRPAPKPKPKGSTRSSAKTKTKGKTR